ncbi:MAG: polyprenyl synthetase family protein [Rhodospirillales bacterium]|nr:polyprenyl synthetase family protein [Rhodospirillales bacterium]MCB9995206.1 polyprenyl synthetase family protein [Rhodospirillales bacterium]
MSTQALQQDTAPQTPLDTLSGLLKDDMLQVNTQIIDNMQSEVPLIPQLAGYLIASGGKRIRPLLTLACTRIYGTDSPRPHALAAAVEFIHTATLLHDDVVDESKQRRGKDAANLVFGNQASVLVGDFLFSRAFQLMVADGSLDVLRILSDASAIIAQGEVKQLTTANNLATTMEDYIEVISAKTAALFAAACEIGPIIAGQDDQAAAMRDYGMYLGIAFQIADDVLDYSANREKLGKTVGDDFREGKMTAPILFALENANDEERAFWQRTVGERRQTETDLAQAQDILNRHDANGKALALARSYSDKAVAALSSHRESPLLSCLTDLARFTVDRSY